MNDCVRAERGEIHGRLRDVVGADLLAPEDLVRRGIHEPVGHVSGARGE
jgi:hypothetical protein